MATYADVEPLKRRVNKTDDTDDAILEVILEAAGRAIDRFCNREDGGFVAPDAASARYYRGSGTNWQSIDECIAITQVAVKDSVTDTTYTAWDTPTTPFAGDGDWLPFSGDPDDPEFNILPYDALLIDPNGDYSTFIGGASASQDYYFAPTLYRSRRSASRSAIARVPTVEVTARWGYAATIPPQITEATIMQASIWYKRLEGSMASVLANSELGTLELFASVDPAIEMILSLGRFIRTPTGRR
jgi:hypothetical protein